MVQIRQLWHGVVPGRSAVVKTNQPSSLGGRGGSPAEEAKLSGVKRTGLEALDPELPDHEVFVPPDIRG